MGLILAGSTPLKHANPLTKSPMLLGAEKFRLNPVVELELVGSSKSAQLPPQTGWFFTARDGVSTMILVTLSHVIPFEFNVPSLQPVTKVTKCRVLLLSYTAQRFPRNTKVGSDLGETDTLNYPRICVKQVLVSFFARK